MMGGAGSYDPLAKGWAIDNVFVKDTDPDQHGARFANIFGGIVRGIRSENTGGNGIYAYNCQGLEIRDQSASNIGVGGRRPNKSGIHFDHCFDCEIDRQEVSGAYSQGGYITAGSGITISRQQITDLTHDRCGAYITGGSIRPSVRNGVYAGSGGTGIESGGTRKNIGVRIEGNDLRGMTAGIKLNVHDAGSIATNNLI